MAKKKTLIHQMKNYTFRIKEENEKRLDELAKALDRPKVWVINKAIEVYEAISTPKVSK